jgi:hypothetical protein
MLQILIFTGAFVYVLLFTAAVYLLFFGRAKEPKYNLELIAQRLKSSLCGTSWQRNNGEIAWEFESSGVGILYVFETRFFLWRQISQGTVEIAFTHGSSDFLGRRYLEDGDPTFIWESELKWMAVDYDVRIEESDILLTGLPESTQVSFSFSEIGIDEIL